MRIHRLTMVICVSLAVAATMDVARAQTPVPKASPGAGIQIAPLTHHVKGSVEKGVCDIPLNGAVLKVTEHWFATGGSGGNDLVRPGHADAAPYLDPLTFNGSPLVQGKLLGSVTVTGAQDFDITWSETATSGRKPWAINVQNTRTGTSLTVYRLLRLEVAPGTNYAGQLNPAPLIQFFGAETTKDVGKVKVNCFSIGG